MGSGHGRSRRRTSCDDEQHEWPTTSLAQYSATSLNFPGLRERSQTLEPSIAPWGEGTERALQSLSRLPPGLAPLRRPTEPACHTRWSCSHGLAREARAMIGVRADAVDDVALHQKPQIEARPRCGQQPPWWTGTGWPESGLSAHRRTPPAEQPRLAAVRSSARTTWGLASSTAKPITQTWPKPPSKLALRQASSTSASNAPRQLGGNLGRLVGHPLIDGLLLLVVAGGAMAASRSGEVGLLAGADFLQHIRAPGRGLFRCRGRGRSCGLLQVLGVALGLGGFGIAGGDDLTLGISVVVEMRSRWQRQRSASSRPPFPLHRWR